MGMTVIPSDDLTVPDDWAGRDSRLIPGTQCAILLPTNVRDLAIAQLMPLIEWPIADDAMFLLLYHCVAVKHPACATVYTDIT